MTGEIEENHELPQTFDRPACDLIPESPEYKASALTTYRIQ
jgi:hypothetical protein